MGWWFGLAISSLSSKGNGVCGLVVWFSCGLPVVGSDLLWVFLDLGFQWWWVLMVVDLLWEWLCILICGGFVVDCLGFMASGCGFRYGFGFVMDCGQWWFSMVVGFDIGLDFLFR